jgi:hypothetical protein
MPISIETELPEQLFDRFAMFVFDHPEWDSNSLINAAIEAFLESQKEATNV